MLAGSSTQQVAQEVFCEAGYSIVGYREAILGPKSGAKHTIRSGVSFRVVRLKSQLTRLLGLLCAGAPVLFQQDRPPGVDPDRENDVRAIYSWLVTYSGGRSPQEHDPQDPEIAVNAEAVCHPRSERGRGITIEIGPAVRFAYRPTTLSWSRASLAFLRRQLQQEADRGSSSLRLVVWRNVWPTQLVRI